MADDKNKLIDFPEYENERQVPWPPEPDAKAPFGTPGGRPPFDNTPPAGKPYHEEYTPDPAAPDPSQTTPGAPDIRDPDTRLPEGTDLGKLSPDVDLKE